jgi:hypothetical protein
MQGLVLFEAIIDGINQRIDEALDGTLSEDRYIRAMGSTLEDMKANRERLKQQVALQVMSDLHRAGILTNDQIYGGRRSQERAILADPDLYESLREGFDEGRPGPTGTQKVGGSATSPEQYETLELPHGE